MAEESKTNATVTTDTTKNDPETKANTKAKKNVNELGEKLVTIKLPLTRESQKDVFVRVNHRTWLIKRGETVQVPECVVEVLNNSERAILEGIEYQNKVQK